MGNDMWIEENITIKKDVSHESESTGEYSCHERQICGNAINLRLAWTT